MNTVTGAPPAIGAFLDFIGRGVRFVSRINRIRHGRAQLYGMPDFMLKDIGISRCEIHSVTRFRRTDPTGSQRS